MDPWKRRFLLETIIFRFHVKLWEGNNHGDRRSPCSKAAFSFQMAELYDFMAYRWGGSLLTTEAFVLGGHFKVEVWVGCFPGIYIRL